MPAAPRKTTTSKTSALAAKQAEATHDEKAEDEAPKTASFEFNGVTYTVPADPLDIPMEIAYAETEYEIIAEIVGPDQWLEFRKSRPTIRQYNQFADLVMKASGQAGDEDEGN
ncbi:tail assembly chaperone [Streptomyces phage Ibantik]|uniref:Tail assembly chaperone n=1 Tax=Streptomyces phage Ibantik TaxID=2182397 RepID=A0A2U8UNI3_9CAUD|nr:tail assembly chaperone [Streptomyces phage Ibantik]AWN05299.1 tail assembly chaperone [Streptomyces phage Ibantik]